MEHLSLPPLHYEHVARHARSIPGMPVILRACSWFADRKYHMQFWKGWSQETNDRK